MTSKVKNIIIFSGIALALILGYVLFAPKSSSGQSNLTVTTPTDVTSQNALVGGGDTSATDAVAQDFLNMLLSVKSINLDDSIFSDPAFASLQDSSLVLVSDISQGRPNPFAPIGNDTAPVDNTNSNSTNSNNLVPTTDTGSSGVVPSPINSPITTTTPNTVPATTNTPSAPATNNTVTQ